MNGRFNLGDLVDRRENYRKPALIDLGHGKKPRTYTHGDIDAAAKAVARGLVGRGFHSGDRIAILAANSAEFLISYLGTMRAGMVSVPINYKFPAATIDYILANAGCRLVFTDSNRCSLVPNRMKMVIFGAAGPDGFQTLLDPGPFQTVMPGSDDVAMILYTSGSTGQPKGVPLTHAGHLWVIAMRLRNRPVRTHRLLVAAPLYHMNGLAISKLALAGHMTIVLMPEFAVRDYIEAIDVHRVSWLTSVAAMMAMVVRERTLLESMDLSMVRIVRMGSAPVSPKLVADIREFFPNARITNGYGTTEVGPVVYGPHPDGVPQPDVSVGYPLSGYTRLVDADGRVSDYGEVQCRNPAVTPGYHGLPDETAATTVDGWFQTGDVMRADENGFHYFVGRLDDMFNCGGENIYPSQVEKLLELHDAVEQACVVPVPDGIKGFKPVAFVVARQGAAVTELEVKDYTLANGPAYQHPRRVAFVESLPLTGTNKVDRNALTRRAEQQLGEDVAGVS